METSKGMKLGERLAELRGDRGLNQKALSKQLHISSSSISAYETGSRLPSIATVFDYAEFFDVTTDYLLGLTDNPVSPSVLTQEFYEGETVGDVIEKLLSLDSKQRSAICLTIENARFYTDVRSKTTTKGKEKL